MIRLSDATRLFCRTSDAMFGRHGNGGSPRGNVIDLHCNSEEIVMKADFGDST